MTENNLFSETKRLGSAAARRRGDDARLACIFRVHRVEILVKPWKRARVTVFINIYNYFADRRIPKTP
jgi:hypothetical protein